MTIALAHASGEQRPSPPLSSLLSSLSTPLLSSHRRRPRCSWSRSLHRPLPTESIDRGQACVTAAAWREWFIVSLHPSPSLPLACLTPHPPIISPRLFFPADPVLTTALCSRAANSLHEAAAAVDRRTQRARRPTGQPFESASQRRFSIVNPLSRMQQTHEHYENSTNPLASFPWPSRSLSSLRQLKFDSSS